MRSRPPFFFPTFVKEIIFAQTFACCLLSGAVFVQAAFAQESAPKSYAEYVSSLDRRCEKDADCQVKNIGNCCGYSPACVNKEAKADPTLVIKLCEAEGLVSVCGWSEITNCHCVEKHCVS